MASGNMNPFARSWTRRGLQYLLRTESVEPESSLMPEHSQEGAEAFELPAQEPPRPMAVGQQGNDTPSTPPQKTASPPTHHAAIWKELPPESWPAQWQTRLKAARKGKVVWTYWELGKDMSNVEDPAKEKRKRFLGKLLKDLAHPAGTHIFWPMALPSPGDTNSYEADDTLFWSGARTLGASAVVVMGEAAATALAFPKKILPKRQLVFRGFLVWAIEDMERLIAEPSHYAMTLAFLRDALFDITRA